MPSPTSYLTTPISYTRNPEPFRQLLDAGRKQTIRFVELGDSQATTPGGFGEPWSFGVNKAFAEFYGNAPETCLNCGGNFGAFGPQHSNQGKWGMAGRNAISPGVSTTPTSELLPSTAVQAPNTSANYQSGQLGIFLMNNISATTPLYRNSNYFDYSGGVRTKLYGFTRSGSSPLTIGNAYNATHAHSFTLSDFQTNINFGQNSAVLSVVSHTSNLMTAPTSAQYLQTGVKTTSGTTPIEIYGWRFMMEANRAGAVHDAFGFGGINATTYLANYGGAGKQLKGSGPYHCAILSFGANDMSTREPAQYKADILALIDFVRGAMNDPSFPIIILTDYQRVISIPADRVRYESYPIMAWEIANENYAVMAINLQRLTYMYGWTAAEMVFTGLTSRGAWSSGAVAYVLNDYVSIDAFPGATVGTDRGTMYYKCVSGHTSSASNGPVDSQYWVPISRMSGASDGVHCNFYAGEIIAKGAVTALISEAYRTTARDVRPWVR